MATNRQRMKEEESDNGGPIWRKLMFSEKKIKSESDSEQDKINFKWWEATREILAFSWLLLPFSTVFMEVSSDKKSHLNKEVKKKSSKLVSQVCQKYILLNQIWANI